MSITDTATTEAHATLVYKGVPVTLDVLSLDAETLAQVERRVERLLARDGWAAPSAPAPAQARPAGDGSPPTCPTHGTAKVRPGQRGGFFCAAKLADGSYCRERPQ